MTVLKPTGSSHLEKIVESEAAFAFANQETVA
jgi:hypothetical protein